jgi:hypothetical protein
MVAPLLALAVAATAAGCGGQPPDPSELDVTSPWQADPITVPAAAMAAAITSCRAADQAVLPGNPPVLVADVRGSGRMFLLFSAPGGGAFPCTVDIARNGTFAASSQASGPLIVRGAPAAGTASIDSAFTDGSAVAGGPSVPTSYAIGRVGNGVLAVDLVFDGGNRIRTSSANGWFAAWWPSAELPRDAETVGPIGSPTGSP